ncbi:uncharacterized protein LOC136079634 isoform X1 [Hydra vulgaris]|uniref:Uncharacterized protein LOC136079634 isoform X1 n=1 Tax=Hydra vulgaris TaxID=6087 RepID=A0ABM4BRL1_HYDVU
MERLDYHIKLAGRFSCVEIVLCVVVSIPYFILSQKAYLLYQKLVFWPVVLCLVSGIYGVIIANFTYKVNAFKKKRLVHIIGFLRSNCEIEFCSETSVLNFTQQFLMGFKPSDLSDHRLCGYVISSLSSALSLFSAAVFIIQNYSPSKVSASICWYNEKYGFCECWVKDLVLRITDDFTCSNISSVTLLLEVCLSLLIISSLVTILAWFIGVFALRRRIYVLRSQSPVTNSVQSNPYISF